MDAAKEATAALEESSGELPEERPMSLYDQAIVSVGTIASNASCLPHIPTPPGTSFAPMPPSPISPCGNMESPPPPGSPAMPEGNAVLDTGSDKCCFAKGGLVRLGDPGQNCGDSRMAASAVIATPKGGVATGA